jgi:hypothetical protein
MALRNISGAPEMVQASARTTLTSRLCARASKSPPRMNFSANYTFGKADGDTDGAGSFPSNSYNLQNEFGRALFDVRHRFTFTGSF